jgi:general transcription factor 3C polypeptide 3 (transcription factor C subunit 4)
VSRGEESIAGPQSASLFEEKSKGKGKAPASKSQHRLNPAQLRELEAQKEQEVLRGYRRVSELWPLILSQGDKQEEAEREWLVEAEKLVDTFRETRNLFLTTRVGSSGDSAGESWWLTDYSRAILFVACFPEVVQLSLVKKQMRIVWLLDFTSISVRLVPLSCPRTLIRILEHDNMTRKGKGKDTDARNIDVFRGVRFEDWLRIFMQVRLSPPSLFIPDVDSVQYSVCILANKTQPFRCCRRDPSAHPLV